MDAALEITAESGLESLSLREIARKIGVTTAAPYHHFKDRQTLLLDLAIEAFGKLLDALSRARATAPNPEAEVVVAVARYLRFGREHRAEYAIMFAGENATHPRLWRDGFHRECMSRSISGEHSGREPTRREGERRGSPFAWSLLHGILQLDQKGVLQETPSERKGLPCKASCNR